MAQGLPWFRERERPGNRCLTAGTPVKKIQANNSRLDEYDRLDLFLQLCQVFAARCHFGDRWLNDLFDDGSLAGVIRACSRERG